MPRDWACRFVTKTFHLQTSHKNVRKNDKVQHPAFRCKCDWNRSRAVLPDLVGLSRNLSNGCKKVQQVTPKGQRTAHSHGCLDWNRSHGAVSVCHEKQHPTLNRKGDLLGCVRKTQERTFGHGGKIEKDEINWRKMDPSIFRAFVCIRVYSCVRARCGPSQPLVYINFAKSLKKKKTNKLAKIRPSKANKSSSQKGLVSTDRSKMTALLSTTPRRKPRSSTNDFAPMHSMG